MASHRGALPRLGPFALADLAQGLARFTRLANRVSLTEPWSSPDAEVLDGQTFESWVRRNLRTPTGRAYFQIACEAVFAAETSDLSLLHALFYCHSGTDLETLISVDRGAQQDRIVGGSIRIAEAMAAELGDRVRPRLRGARVIEQDDARRPGRAARAARMRRRQPRGRHPAADPGRAAGLRDRRCRPGATSSPSGCRPGR